MVLPFNKKNGSKNKPVFKEWIIYTLFIVNFSQKIEQEE
jgi:hypothetical protein